ncbi:hypothetical protein GGR50DRAFT_628329 [Xylaria sp. CBS 124048]|nr:hypothetical protein GGR50DRAFT_628329 [Xylaria sp. CBS 124048]
MADPTRQSAFMMPTIKCSNCGDQVEISVMGEHVCGSSKKSTTTEPISTGDSHGGAFSSLRQNVFNKWSRATPTVDTLAANRAFARYDQLTPVSASNSISPRTPLNGRPGALPSHRDASPAIAEFPQQPSFLAGLIPESLDGELSFGPNPNKSSLFTRMDNIIPGPFEIARTLSPRVPTFPRRVSEDVSDPGDENSRLGSSMERPGTAASNNGGMNVPRMPQKNGYGGFGPPSREGGGDGLQPPAFGRRAETFPDQLPSSGGDTLALDSPTRAPSAPGLRPEWPNRPGYGIRDTSRPPPPRKSLVRPPTRDGTQNPSINLDNEFGAGNPYHSPSVSQSSSNSGYSQGSIASNPSSNTSPARSVGTRSEPRKSSDVVGIDSLIDDLQSSIGGLQPVLPGGSIPASLRPGSRIEPLHPLRVNSPPPLEAGEKSLGSPVSLKSGPDSDKVGLAPEEDAGRSRSQAASDLGSGSHNRDPSRNPRQRGTCRACQEPITGKSVSSADGRLTGRYHKACFVCTACKEPFASSTFYVHEDRPYCEQHYHKLNGSLCGSCHRGIEGQYLEDEVPQKYHPDCFRCEDCGAVLRDGYFDVNGRSYCERDAWGRMQAAMSSQQAPPKSPLGPPSGMGMRGPPPAGVSRIREPPRGAPPGGSSNLHRPFGQPTGQRLMPGQALGRGGLGPTQKLQRRMTRMGMM